MDAAWAEVLQRFDTEAGIKRGEGSVGKLNYVPKAYAVRGAVYGSVSICVMKRILGISFKADGFWRDLARDSCTQGRDRDIVIGLIRAILELRAGMCKCLL